MLTAKENKLFGTFQDIHQSLEHEIIFEKLFLPSNNLFKTLCVPK